MASDEQLRYISHYPAELLDKVLLLIDRNRLGELILSRYPDAHDIRTDKALYEFVLDLKKRHMRQSATVSKIRFDDRISALHNALGQHRFTSRVQGNKLRAKSEIVISSVFKKAPLAFLQMIAVHELAHLREKNHDKAFYRLCEYMMPDYHTIEFDMRLFLTHVTVHGPLYD
ncbi:MAG: M48 family metallopeptidase [Deltaproteobacteria bacterium]|nr:M48 family metallopeptidase [Deltaproteobacteria bacterium]